MKNPTPSLRALTLAVAAAGLTLPAAAVVVTTVPANTSPPPGNPFFANVGELNGASAIYLGNGWVMTADHVAPALPATVTFGGTAYATQSGTWQQLSNPTGGGLTPLSDIVLFRLSTSPALGAVTVSTVPTPISSTITMVGNGRLQENTITTWNVTTGPGANDDVWTEGGTPTTNSGYKTTATHAISWGQNVVTAGPGAVNTGTYDTISFYTTFDQSGGLTQEGQGVNGDSGGAAFRLVAGNWQLSGMTHAVSSFENQPTVSGVPGSTAVYGDLTFFADLSFYSTQIASITAVPEPSGLAVGALGALALFRRRRAD